MGQGMQNGEQSSNGYSVSLKGEENALKLIVVMDAKL